MSNKELISTKRNKLTNWNILGRPITELKWEMEDLVNDFLNRLSLTNGFLSPNFSDFSTMLTLNYDLVEDNKNYIVKIDLPGMEEKDLDVSWDNGLLTIKGEKKEEKTDESTRYHRRKCLYGAFKQSLMLPDNIKEEEIKASFKNGVLKIIVPKTEGKGSSVKKIELQKEI